MFPFTHHTDAKDSRPVQATAVPAGTKATKLQPAKTADKGKKQAAVKKAGINTTAESAEDKNKQTKPQVTHELSVVCFLILKKYCFYILSHCNVHHWCVCSAILIFQTLFGEKGFGRNDQDVQGFAIIRVIIRRSKLENSLFTRQISYMWQLMTIFYSDVEPLSEYSPVILHLSPATRILNENPDNYFLQVLLI